MCPQLDVSDTINDHKIATYVRQHRRSQEFCLGATRPTPPSLTSVMHTFEAVAGRWGPVSAPAVSRVIGVAPERKQNIILFRGNYIWGRFFVNAVSLKYIGMIYINVGEMCFIPMNVHNELFNGVRQLIWQHISSVGSYFSTSIRLLSSIFIKHCTLPPFLSVSVRLSLCLSSLSVVRHPVFLISGLSLRFGDVGVFFLQSKVVCN